MQHLDLVRLRAQKQCTPLHSRQRFVHLWDVVLGKKEPVAVMGPKAECLPQIGHIPEEDPHVQLATSFLSQAHPAEAVQSWQLLPACRLRGPCRGEEGYYCGHALFSLRWALETQPRKTSCA